jgi:hypothetical protein
MSPPATPLLSMRAQQKPEREYFIRNRGWVGELFNNNVSVMKENAAAAAAACVARTC